MTTRDALEAALVATPDDVALHSAYADLLLEQGDPRGEYIRLQLAAEDRNQAVDKLRELEDAAHQIRQAHEREWLGGLWPFVQRPPSARSVAEPMEANVTITWRRGWIDAVLVWQLSDELVSSIADHPLTRLLARFEVERDSTPSPDGHGNDPVDLEPLTASLRTRNLRHFQLGSLARREIADGWRLERHLRQMRRLESIRLCVHRFADAKLFGGDYPGLHTIDLSYNSPRSRFYILGFNDKLPNLQRLSVDTVSTMPPRDQVRAEWQPILSSDLRTFFRTNYLQKLEHLTLRMGDFGDPGVEELLSSGFITRLKGLDLSGCNITDEGAQRLAAHPHVRRLDHLHLENNLLSPVGVDALEAAGVPVSLTQLFVDWVFDSNETADRQ